MDIKLFNSFSHLVFWFYATNTNIKLNSTMITTSNNCPTFLNDKVLRSYLFTRNCGNFLSFGPNSFRISTNMNKTCIKKPLKRRKETTVHSIKALMDHVPSWILVKRGFWCWAISGSGSGHLSEHLRSDMYNRKKKDSRLS